eukprot:TRINITY_DN2492_c0_g1_i1.p1 TRINITY_DN2492_c0_g1~~TRINITY_DN2492_c0_g1_i1.p1  ORF type:complete len:173 (+),score=28.82 TRINITY_DN2492_c0_g1_i1:65-583(+)
MFNNESNPPNSKSMQDTQPSLPDLILKSSLEAEFRKQLELLREFYEMKFNNLIGGEHQKDPELSHEDFKMNTVVKLNVGGQIFQTKYSTLANQYPDSFFGSMFSGRYETVRDENGAYFIDRDPMVFKYVLNILRGANVSVKYLSEEEKEMLSDDLDYYMVRFLFVKSESGVS